MNATKCHFFAIGRAPAPQLSLSTVNPGSFMHIANLAEGLGILMDNSFSPAIYCKQAARGMLCMMRRLFVELSVSAFAALKKTLVQPHLEHAVGDEAR